MARSIDSAAQRRKLLGEIARLAEIAIFGTLSETYRSCGQVAATAKEMDPSWNGRVVNHELVVKGLKRTGHARP
jgi:hypothetical protein